MSVYFKAHFSHVKTHFTPVPVLGRSLTKLRQHPDMTIAVDWDVKQQMYQESYKCIAKKKKKAF